MPNVRVPSLVSRLESDKEAALREDVKSLLPTQYAKTVNTLEDETVLNEIYYTCSMYTPRLALGRKIALRSKYMRLVKYHELTNDQLSI